jgi:hypothetical protein
MDIADEPLAIHDKVWVEFGIEQGDSPSSKFRRQLIAQIQNKIRLINGSGLGKAENPSTDFGDEQPISSRHLLDTRRFLKSQFGKRS